MPRSYHLPSVLQQLLAYGGADYAQGWQVNSNSLPAPLQLFTLQLSQDISYSPLSYVHTGPASDRVTRLHAGWVFPRGRACSGVREVLTTLVRAARRSRCAATCHGLASRTMQ